MHTMPERRIWSDSRTRRTPLAPLLGLLILASTWLLGEGVLSDPLAQVEARLRYDAAPAVLGEVRLVGLTRDGVTRWQPEVVYRFRLGATTWQSRRYAWVTPAFDSRAEGEALVATLREGGLTAWYDPSNPDRAVLDRSLPGLAVWAEIAPWLVALALGGLLLLHGLRGRPARR